jgi:GDP-L-fucose synthase
MKVLVTGANGFVGKNLMPKLLDYYCVCTLPHRKCDLRDKSLAEYFIKSQKPDIIVHLAAKVGGIGANQAHPGEFMYDNLTMGINVIEAARKINAKMIMLGTVCSYPKFCPIPFQEKELWNGYPEETNAPYGIAKKTLVELIISYHKEYDFNGINLLPVNLYGPEDSFDLETNHVIPALIMKINDAIVNDMDLVVWGSGKASREFLYVEDLCDAILLAINHNDPFPINIGTGKEIKIRDLTRIICNLMGFNGTIVWDTTKPDGQPRRCLDTNKAEIKLGFTAQTKLEVGLQKTIEWFHANIT